MKFLKAILLLTFATLILSKKFIPSQTHIVYDKRPEVAQLNHIVRTTPTLTTKINYGYPSASTVSNRVSFSNNNDNNGYNLGSYGKTAIIANPAIYVHNTEDMSVVHHTPAVVGYRNERDTISSVNKQTGHVEQHQITRSIPIEGTIERVHTLKKETSRRLDLTNSQWGPITTTISEKN